MLYKLNNSLELLFYLQNGGNLPSEFICIASGEYVINWGLFRDNLGFIYLCFSGVNDVKDVISLLDCTIRKRSEGGIVSDPFQIFVNIKNQIDINPSTNIDFICGYSTGAVIATYYQYYVNKSNDTNVYLFSSFRPGDQNFSNSYDLLYYNNTYRFALQGDVITNLPVYGYHVGSPYTFVKSELIKDWDFTLPFWDNPKFYVLSLFIIIVYGLSLYLRLIPNKHDLSNYKNQILSSS
jgi:hypothetical protein